jgi:transcriptional regulator with XRE-family HTH domain
MTAVDRPIQSLRLDVEALYVALDVERRRQRIKWREIARQCGCSSSTMTRIGQGKRPDADALVRLITWLDAPIAKFTTHVESD